MQILIIEDEPRAVNQLQNMLKKCSFDYQLLGIIDTIEDAVQWFQKNTHVDLVFMDIQLADGLSFEIFQKAEVEVPIIFTTAFDQYAIQAFKVNSIDYLLKPIQKDELTSALNKFEKSNKSATIDPAIFKQLLGSIQLAPTREGILVKEGNGFIQVKITDILYFFSEEGLTFGATATKQYLIEETLDTLFQTLDLTQFYKINRGQLISKSAIQKIRPYLNHRLKLIVLGQRKQEFIVSRQKAKDFKEWVNR